MNTSESSDNRAGHGGLGVCWIVYGLLRLVIAACLIVYEPVATVMFGALLARVADVGLAMGLFHTFYLCAIILSVVCGALGLLGGAVLLRQRTSRLAVWAAFLSLPELPVGIILGVYTLLTIFKPRGAEPR